jgi:hypothetical protein
MRWFIHANGPQADAFACADSLSDTDHVRVFACELDNGKRGYGAGTVQDFFVSEYRWKPPADRALYELVREGRPCYLYVDLDRKNPTLAHAAAAQRFVSATRAALMRAVGGDVSCQTVMLDASNRDVFSQHYVFKTPGVMFADNSACGVLIAGVLAALRDDADVQDVVDSGVYSRNRLMRLYASAKRANILARRARYLRYEDEPPHAQPPPLDAARFETSLITWPIVAGTRYIAAPAVPHSPHSPSPSSPLPTARAPAQSDPLVTDIFLHLREAPANWQRDRSGHRILLHSEQHQCPALGGEHKGRHMYWSVDLRTAAATLMCNDAECKRRMASAAGAAVRLDVRRITEPLAARVRALDMPTFVSISEIIPGMRV